MLFQVPVEATPSSSQAAPSFLAKGGQPGGSASKLSPAAPSSIRSLAERIQRMRRAPDRPAEVIQAKNFLSNLDELDLSTEGIVQTIQAQIDILKPHATPQETHHLNSLEENLEKLSDCIRDVQEVSIEAREQEEMYSELNQTVETEEKQLEEHFEKTILGVESEIQELEKRKAAIEAEIARKTQFRDQEIAHAEQKVLELQNRREAVKRASQAAQTAASQLKVCMAELNLVKVEIDVQGKLLK